MKKLILLFSILLISLTVYSSNRVDSLALELENYAKQDTVRINMIYEYSRASNLNWTDTNKVLMDEAFLLSKKLNYKEGIAEGHFLIGWYYVFQSENELAIENYLKAIKRFKELDNTSKLLRAYSNLSNVYNSTNDFEKALALNLKAIRLAKDLPASPTKASYYFYTAKTYDRMEDYINSGKYFEGAKKIAEACNFEVGIAISNGSLGQNYTMQKKFDKALPLIKKFLTFTIKTNQKINIAGAYKSLGECYWYMGNYSKALPNLLKAIEIFEELEYKEYLGVLYSRTAETYEFLNQPKNAIIFYKKSREIIIELNTKERESAIEELKAKYETDQLKQDKIIAQANETIAKEKEIHSKNLNYVAIGIILLIGLFLIYIYKQLKLIQQQKKELDVAYDQLELSKKHELAASNLKAIKSQMNPHFIFNSINSIQDLVLQQESLKSYDYLVVFSKLVRNILDYSEREFIPLDEEISFLNTYLGLEKLRFKDEFEFTISSTLLAKGTLIPSLIIQPFAENAIKHGLLHKEGKKQLHITFTEQENGILCTVKDNGIGIEESKKIKARQGNAHKSFSTEAIQKRLSLLQEQTQSNSGYVMQTIFDDNGNVAGTEVLITLPIK